ncbi:MAG TPA: hypothetical protein VEG84_09840 [Thermoanaerobaculia bacterium]|nr:hypothetical protein [Thermoanaerobaculia bacterium]
MRGQAAVFERGIRPALAWASLLILAAAEISRLPLGALPQRLAGARHLPATHNTTRVNQAAVWFDPAYAPFLEAVRQHTPASATVVLVAPEKMELYLYTAVYVLAPRRVVGEADVGSASYIAIYGPAPRSGLADGKAIPGGMLATR